MFSVFNVVHIGTLILILYILFDFFKNKTNLLVRRIIFYSFIFYLLSVIQLTTGGIVFPPQPDFYSDFKRVQLVPFEFIWDWYEIYLNKSFDWFFWNSIKLTFYNFIMLMPLGIYLSLLYNLKSTKRAVIIVFLTSFTIETSQLIGGYIGIILGRTFNIDDLMLNTLGGIIGFILFGFFRGIFKSTRNKENTEIS